MLKLPHWVTDSSVPLDERRRRAVDFVVHYIAVLHNRTGSIDDLAKEAGLSVQTLYCSRQRGYITSNAGRTLANIDNAPLTYDEIMSIAGRDSLATLTTADLNRSR